MKRILLIEDDADLREIISFQMERAGYDIKAAGSAEEGLKMFDAGISLILLDVMLPGISGYELASLLRRRGDRVPIIFLTARTSEEDLLEGFSSGGDDYVGKPFSAAELIARVAAVLRRSGEDEAKSFDCGPLHLDLNTGAASVGGRNVVFSRKEFDILTLLIRNQGKYFTRSEIIKELWADAPYVIDRTIDVHIAHIRSKLDEYKDLLVSRTGFGYSLINEKEKEL